MGEEKIKEPTKIDPIPPVLFKVAPPSKGYLSLRLNRLKQMDAIRWLISRAKEGSTWAGIAIMASALGISPEIATGGVDLLVAAAAFVAIFLKDKTAEPTG